MSETGTEAQRALRMCDSCGQVDTAPRHVYGRVAGEGETSEEVFTKALNAADSDEAKAAVFAHARDNSTTMKHMDCCRNDGCPDGTCDQLLQDADNAQNDELVSYLTSLGPEEE